MFPVLAAANVGSCVGPQNEKELPDAGSRVECPRNINGLKNMTCGIMACEITTLRQNEVCV